MGASHSGDVPIPHGVLQQEAVFVADEVIEATVQDMVNAVVEVYGHSRRDAPGPASVPDPAPVETAVPPQRLDNADQISADAAFLEVVRENNFEGPRWTELVDDMVAYAAPVLDSRIRSGLIFGMKFMTGKKTVPDWQREMLQDKAFREDIVATAMAVAVGRMHKALRAGKGWRPDGGASLASYFFGSCVMAFAETLAKHRTLSSEELSWNGFATTADDQGYEPADRMRLYAPTVSVESAVLDTAEIRAALAELDPIDRELVFLRTQGYRYREIAQDFLGKTPKTWQRRWDRLAADHAWVGRLFPRTHETEASTSKGAS